VTHDCIILFSFYDRSATGGYSVKAMLDFVGKLYEQRAPLITAAKRARGHGVAAQVRDFLTADANAGSTSINNNRGDNVWGAPVKALLLSRRASPHVLTHYLAARFRGRVSFLHVCMTCNGETEHKVGSITLVFLLCVGFTSRFCTFA
jgi:hypothetical protein